MALVAPLVVSEEGERVPPPQLKKEGEERRVVAPVALVESERGRERSLLAKKPVALKEEEGSLLPPKKLPREEEGEPLVVKDQGAQIPALNLENPHPELKSLTD